MKTKKDEKTKKAAKQMEVKDEDRDGKDMEEGAEEEVPTHEESVEVGPKKKEGAQTMKNTEGTDEKDKPRGQ